MSSNNSSGIVWLFLILLIVIGVFVLFGHKIKYTQKIHQTLFTTPPIEKWFAKKNVDYPINTTQNANVQLVTPPESADWCKIQNITVTKDDQDPISEEIIGWDITQNCCVRKIQGFDCAIKKNVTIRYCYTAEVLGNIPYVTINGYNGDVLKLQQYIKNVDKEYIEGKICDQTTYPTNA